MKVESTLLDDHQVRLRVEIESEQLESAKRQAARKLSRKMKIPGFRPGKAPYAVLLRHIGEGTILEEGLEILVEEIYPDVISQAGIEPYGPGILENIESVTPLVLQFVIPLEAQVELGDYRSISKSYDQPVIFDKDVDQLIENLRTQQAILEPVDRPANVDDVVTIRLNAVQLGENEAETLIIDGQTHTFLVKDNTQVTEGEIDKEVNIKEWPFPGFSSELNGLMVGEKKSVIHAFPDNWHVESLKSSTVRYEFEVSEIKSRTLPELDDAFISVFGEFADLADFRERIRENLENQSQEEYGQEYDEDILSQLIELSNIRFPPQMLERQLETVTDDLRQRLEEQNLDLDIYLKTRNMSMEELQEDLTPVAEGRLKRSLVLLELAKEENIQVAKEELEQETTQTINMLSRSLSQQDARQLSGQSMMEHLVGNIAVSILARKAMRRLHDIASGQYNPEEQIPEAVISDAITDRDVGVSDGVAETGSQPDFPNNSVENPLDITNTDQQEALSREEVPSE